MIRLSVAVIIFILSRIEANDLVIGDPSGAVSVSFQDGNWTITPGLMDWDDDINLVARANFTNAQSSTGWMMLEVETRESAPDQLQAEAAGIAEGYLTRISILEAYREFFLHDAICLENEGFCQWAASKFEANEALVSGKIKQFSQTEPYWHQVNLYYLQMEGMSKGYLEKALQDPRPQGQ